MFLRVAFVRTDNTGMLLMYVAVFTLSELSISAIIQAGLTIFI